MELVKIVDIEELLKIESMEEGFNTIKKRLSEMIGTDVKVVLYTELRDYTLGNMNLGDPSELTTEYMINFLGVYGLGKRPLYAHGKNTKDGKDMLFRNNLDIWLDENTGNPTHEEHTQLISLGEIDVRQWFSRYTSLEDESALYRRIKDAEPKEEVLSSWTEDVYILKIRRKDAELKEKTLAKKILEGRPFYIPGVWNPSLAVFDETRFISKVITYLDKIV